MARLSLAEQRAYQEELEHTHSVSRRTNPHSDEMEELEYRHQMYPNEKKPRDPTAIERLSGIGASITRTAREIGQNPHIRQIASGSGFGGNRAPQSQRGRSRAPQPHQQQAPTGSPGQTVYLTICDEFGECRQKRISGGRPRQPRQRNAGYFAGTLGGDDPGFW